jgi:Flp pilus assembly protein CpaB
VQFAQRLLSTRGGTVAVSAAAAVLAAAVFIAYLHRYRESVNSSNQPVTILISRGLIERGTPGNVVGSEGLYQFTSTPKDEVLDGAITDPDLLRGRLATEDIYPGQQLTLSQFTASGADAIGNRLTADQRAISVPIDVAHGLVGKVQIGDRVDIFAGFNVKRLKPDGTQDTGVAERAVLKRIIEDVIVLAVPEQAAGGFARAEKSEVTLRMTDKQAADLAFSSDNGKVWIILRPKANAKAAPPNLVTVETVLFGVPPMTIVKSLGGRG